jgi:hypothetical protein
VTGCARGVLSWSGVGFDAFTASGDILSKSGKGTLWLTPGMKVKFLLKCPNTQIASYVVVKYKGAGARITECEAARAAAFGRPVDLISRKSINKYIREQVLADAQPLYAA